MQHYKADSSVIFTDEAGRQIDTFVIADTDTHTGLTHIKHGNLKVAGDRLKLHVKTACDYHMPIADSFSFEMIRKLRDKYAVQDALKMATISQMPEISVLANAS
ncbi:hypothetical protein [Mucilaginibacter jinjuensis]|uniref:Uncharacterized protein n=1 Tax=Mucilaginibacter jinjuensis TaxID=1176721 RepID=A0ABY7TDR0_9SPHI|nr:hypothetical protein [Mucilaginibacter jinjuensis]WCT13767.1 hypothetical protein PQO05_07445 [Mucilaginibacter jinjuensis]